MMMVSSSTRRRLIAEGRRLHMAIVAWGRKQGVWAYIVMPSPGVAYFEIWDPKAKTISYNFPAKIRKAIETHKVELSAYSSCECGHPPGQVLPEGLLGYAGARKGREGCDCNGGVRSGSPIKTAICDAAGAGSRKTDAAAGGGEKRGEVDFRP